MSSEPVYRRVGRGGAGNWYSKKDVEEAEKAQAADLEAQKGAAAGSGAPIERSITSATTATLSSSGYARSGRGGAGNFSDQTSAVGTQQETEQDAEKIKAAVTASLSNRASAAGEVPATGLEQQHLTTTTTTTARRRSRRRSRRRWRRLSSR